MRLSITDLASCVYRPERCVAVRGDLIAAREGAGCGCCTRHRRLSATLAAVAEFLRHLGVEVQLEADPDVPVLMKNLVMQAIGRFPG